MSVYIADLEVHQRGREFVCTAVAQSDFTPTVFSLYAHAFTLQKALDEVYRIARELDSELKPKVSA